MRFATEKYTSCLESINKRFVHLTNYSVNKYSENYVENNNLGEFVPATHDNSGPIECGPADAGVG